MACRLPCGTTISAARSQIVRTKLAVAESSYKAGEWKDAEKLIRELLADNPKHTAVLTTAGEIFCSTGRYQAGMEHYSRAIEIDAENIAALFGKAIVLAACPEKEFRDGNLAIKLARHIGKMKLGKSDQLRVTMLVAVARAELGDFDQTSGLIQEAIKEANLDSGIRLELEQKLKLFQERKPFIIPIQQNQKK